MSSDAAVAADFQLLADSDAEVLIPGLDHEMNRFARPLAATAVPALDRLVDDEDLSVKWGARKALERIRDGDGH